MNLFNNKKVNDLQERINYLQNEINNLDENFEKLEFQIKNPKPYNIGDKYSKNEIVTNIDIIKRWTLIAVGFSRYQMYYNVELTNIKTGEKSYKLL